ncbi:integrase [Halioglobus sp. HI00S01]|uniref:site-specific integrase n=1 Tax=Halioglobus sp. HI00S01 TaxID=1822214 RepID=UPI0007C24EC0|nr:site-specific integrase [Halioglobus sp. HI00S01]KZX57999.1 integrase [Halioglobus sp. HI00S01]
MPKTGQARVPTDEEWQHVFDVIQQHRHPEKNTAIMQISAKLGLRVQEIALLQIKEVARLKKTPPGFTLFEVMALPAAYTKGANAMGRSKSTYARRTLSFSVEEFDRVVGQIADLAKAGVDIDPARFYPPVKNRSGQSRDLPLVDEELRDALFAYLALRLDKNPSARPTDPLFITQKGGPYSPNTLQEHMALILRDWAGIEKASSHSGRRSVMTNIIHKQKKPLKVAQKVAGHKSASTTLIYDEPPEEAISDALANLTEK